MAITNIYGNNNGLTKEPDRVYVNIGGQSVELWSKQLIEKHYLIQNGVLVNEFEGQTLTKVSGSSSGSFTFNDGYIEIEGLQASGKNYKCGINLPVSFSGYNYLCADLNYYWKSGSTVSSSQNATIYFTDSFVMESNILS